MPRNQAFTPEIMQFGHDLYWGSHLRYTYKLITISPISPPIPETVKDKDGSQCLQEREHSTTIPARGEQQQHRDTKYENT